MSKSDQDGQESQLPEPPVLAPLEGVKPTPGSIRAASEAVSLVLILIKDQGHTSGNIPAASRGTRICTNRQSLDFFTIASGHPKGVDPERTAVKDITKQPQCLFILTPQWAQENLLDLAIPSSEGGWLVDTACKNGSN